MILYRSRWSSISKSLLSMFSFHERALLYSHTSHGSEGDRGLHTALSRSQVSLHMSETVVSNGRIA